MGKLYFHYSTMNAGKSTALLQANHNYIERGMKTHLLTAKLDDRAGVSTGVDTTVLAPSVLCVPNSQGSVPRRHALYVRSTRTSLGRAARAAFTMAPQLRSPWHPRCRRSDPQSDRDLAARRGLRQRHRPARAARRALRARADRVRLRGRGAVPLQAAGRLSVRLRRSSSPGSRCGEAGSSAHTLHAPCARLHAPCLPDARPRPAQGTRSLHSVGWPPPNPNRRGTALP